MHLPNYIPQYATLISPPIIIIISSSFISIIVVAKIFFVFILNFLKLESLRNLKI